MFTPEIIIEAYLTYLVVAVASVRLLISKLDRSLSNKSSIPVSLETSEGLACINGGKHNLIKLMIAKFYYTGRVTIEPVPNGRYNKDRYIRRIEASPIEDLTPTELGVLDYFTFAKYTTNLLLDSKLNALVEDFAAELNQDAIEAGLLYSNESKKLIYRILSSFCWTLMLFGLVIIVNEPHWIAEIIPGSLTEIILIWILSSYSGRTKKGSRYINEVKSRLQRNVRGLQNWNKETSEPIDEIQLKKYAVDHIPFREIYTTPSD